MLTYKQIGLYDAETKKSKTVNIKRSKFENEDLLNEYCKQLREENRERNRLYRIQMAANPTVSIRHEPMVLPGTESPTIKHLSGVKMKLDPKTGSTVVIYGSSKRGKSTLMMRLYDKYFKSNKIISTLFSDNPQLKVYKGNEDLIIGHGFSEESARYIQLQQFINTKTDNEYKFLELFDDIIDAKASGVINKLVLTYRNSNISMIMCLQYVFLLSKANRANINHTFVFGMNSGEDCESVIDVVLKSYFNDLGVIGLVNQLKFFREVTADHGFIYIDNIAATISFHRLDPNKYKRKK